MARKMPARLVALSASAVATIYLAGLVATQPAAATVAAAPAIPAAAVSTSTPAAPSASPVIVGASATTTTTTTTTSSSTSASTYADGAYSGTGTSRFGNVSVSVTVAGGKISNVQISKVTTSFPAARIASLPAAVVASQSANVNVVSGATYSATAFKAAVQQALAQAQAASTPTTSQG